MYNDENDKSNYKNDNLNNDDEFEEFVNENYEDFNSAETNMRFDSEKDFIDTTTYIYKDDSNKNRKRKLLLIFIIAPIFFISVFILSIIIANYFNLFENYQTLIDYKYSSKISSKISTLESQIENSLTKNNLTSEELIEKYNKLEEYYDEVETYARIEYVNTCYYVDNANARRYKKYNSILADMDEWLASIKVDIYYSGYSADFYANFSDYEIDLIVNHPETKESISKKAEVDELVVDYSNNSENLTENEVWTYLANLINLNNEYAALKGYSNYIEYAYYEQYNRDYEYSDTLAYASYVNKYILGQNGALNQLIKNSNKLLESPFSLIGRIDTDNYSVWGDYTSAYAEYLGGSYLENYTDFCTNGYIVESDAGYYDGGFSSFLTSLDKPIMYLGGNDYQNVFTYIHEYGHCNAFYSMKNNDVSLDLCETQSQGNEMMFLAYLLYIDDSFSNSKAYLKNKQEINMIENVIVSCAVNSFEIALYTNSNLTAGNINSIMKQTFEDVYSNNNNMISYSTLKNYAKAVMISSPCYYISYSTSAVSAFELFVEASKDYDNAINTYDYLSNYANYTNFRDTITGSGLTDPLTEDAFKLVFETNISYLL